MRQLVANKSRPKLYTEQPREWDRLIPPVLFAFREIPNNTLKLSSFELLNSSEEIASMILKPKVCQICIVDDHPISNDVCDTAVSDNPTTKFSITQNSSNEQKQQMNELLKSFDEEVQRMLRLDVVEPSTSPYCSPVVLVKKANNTLRFCVDFRSLNDIDAKPMPTIDEALGNFIGDKYFSEIDTCKGPQIRERLKILETAPPGQR
ncbi:uncharacterized protein LOC125036379 [Penaeus chinensis]|uniref:uncharacterized protein LOC125036379 n=1 Tax=Penaeus chinensis TaxID=139456 RepID=UPI001FB85631|nr:uncharacterized protein LOC125036379 [Penaeus chinensis]